MTIRRLGVSLSLSASVSALTAGQTSVVGRVGAGNGAVVYKNGVPLASSAFTVDASGNVTVTTSALAAGDQITIAPVKTGTGATSTVPGYAALAISGTPPGATINSAYSFTPTVTGGAGAKTFSFAGTLQPGFSFSNTSGFSGAPTTGATQTGTITVTDGAGNQATLSISIPVTTTVYLPTLATTPAVYSLTKMVSGYSGPVAAACSTSDANATPTTSVDITSNGDGTPNYAAAITAFGNRFKIWKHYDQSATYDPATNTDPNTRPVVQTNYDFGKAAWFPAYVDNYGWLNLPTTLATSRQNSTLITIVSGVNGGQGNNLTYLSALGTTDITASSQLVTQAYAANGGLGARGQVQAASTLMIDSSTPTFAALVMGSSALKFFRNTESYSTTAFTAASMTGGLIGSGVYNTTAPMTRHHADIIYPAALSDTDVASVRSAASAIFGITNRTGQILSDGDSIALGFGATDTRNLDYFLKPKLTNRSIYVFNTGVGGRTINDIVTNRAAGWYTARYRSDLAKNIYLFKPSPNDIAGSQTDVQIEADLTTIVQRAQAAGFVVAVQTMLPFGFSGTNETYRLNVNAWIRANAASLGFTLIDYGDNGPAGMTYTNNHPNSINGYDLMANVAGPVLNGMLQ